MIIELNHSYSRIDVPEHTGHVPRTRQDLTIVQEATTTQISRMSAELPRDLDRPLLRPQIVNGTDVVESTAGDEVAGGGEGAGHDPGGPQGDGVDLVGRVGVPDDEFPVLRGGDEVSLVLRKVHGVDFSEMAFERPSRPHGDTWEWIEVVGHGAYYVGGSIRRTRAELSRSDDVRVVSAN